MMIYARNTDTGEHRIASSKNHTAAALGCYLNSDEVLVEASRDGWISFSGQEPPINREAICDIQFSFNDCEKRYKVPMSKAFDWGKVKAYRPVFDSKKVSTSNLATKWAPEAGIRCKARHLGFGSEFECTINGFKDGKVWFTDHTQGIDRDFVYYKQVLDFLPLAIERELLPCPFCGCVEHLEFEYQYEHCCRVICNAANGGCGATGGGGELSECAEEQWNTRSS